MEIRAFKESHENVNKGLDIVLAQFQVATDISLHRSQKPTCSRFRLKLTRLFCVFHCDSSSSVVCYCAFVSERSIELFPSLQVRNTQLWIFFLISK